MKNLRRKHEMGWSVKIGYRCTQKQNFKPWKWVLASVQANLKPSVYENIVKQIVYTVIFSCYHQFFEWVAPPTLTFRFKSRFNSNWAKSISPSKQCSSISLPQPQLLIKYIIFSTFIPLINKCTTGESSKETPSSYTKCECFVNRSVYSSVQTIFFSFLFLVVQYRHDNPIERYVWTADKKKERKIVQSCRVHVMSMVSIEALLGLPFPTACLAW